MGGSGEGVGLRRAWGCVAPGAARPCQDVPFIVGNDPQGSYPRNHIPGILCPAPPWQAESCGHLAFNYKPASANKRDKKQHLAWPARTRPRTRTRVPGAFLEDEGPELAGVRGRRMSDTLSNQEDQPAPNDGVRLLASGSDPPLPDNYKQTRDIW